LRVLLALLALPAFAQIESVKFHYGDDIRWAAPGFDDTNWMDANDKIDYLAHLSVNRYWVRLKVRMPDRALRPVVGTMTPVTELYAEGHLIGKSGSFPPEFHDAPYRYRV
jgi:hypothetical protein